MRLLCLWIDDFDELRLIKILFLRFRSDQRQSNAFYLRTRASSAGRIDRSCCETYAIKILRCLDGKCLDFAFVQSSCWVQYLAFRLTLIIDQFHLKFRFFIEKFSSQRFQIDLIDARVRRLWFLLRLSHGEVVVGSGPFD